MDEHTVKRIIDELGGAKALMEEMDEYQETVLRMRKERPRLAADYPDKWVAMGGEGLLAAGDSMDQVLGQLEAQGVDGADVVIEFRDTDPPLLLIAKPQGSNEGLPSPLGRDAINHWYMQCDPTLSRLDCAVRYADHTPDPA